MEIDRRRFCKLALGSGLGVGLAGGLGAAGVRYGTELAENVLKYLIEEKIDQITSSNYILPQNCVPEYLAGNVINTPYLWIRENDFIKEVVKNDIEFNAINRMFLPCFVDREGKINDKLVDTVKRFLNNPLLKGTRGFIAVFTDGYPIFRRDKWNPWYKPKPLNSEFIDLAKGNIEQQQLEVFTKAENIDRLNQITTTATEILKDEEMIVAYEVMNEPDITILNIPFEQKKEIFTGWYGKTIPPIRAIDKKRKIIVDSRDQRLIDSSKLDHLNIARSIHSYMLLLNSLDIPFIEVVNSNSPFMATEMGASEVLPEEDLLLANSILDLFFGFVHYNSVIYNTTYGIWKLDNYNDSFNFNRKRYPHTTRVMRLIRDKIPLIYKNNFMNQQLQFSPA